MTQHIPVMPDEVVAWLAPGTPRQLLDGTLGGGGHARRLADALTSTGHVYAIDRDPEAVARSTSQLQSLPVTCLHGSYRDAAELLAMEDVSHVDGIVLDLGLSSDQLGDSERGFSFRADGALDLRFDPTRGEPAWRMIRRLSERHLADLIYRYGDERRSRAIASALVEALRRDRALQSAAGIAEIIERAVPKSRDTRRIHPATRTFQALRIAVNREMEHLEIGLRRLPDLLRPGGRIAIITFHSIEDRIVKFAFRADQRLLVLTKKPQRPTAKEIDENPRSRSAKLRVAERVDA